MEEAGRNQISLSFPPFVFRPLVLWTGLQVFKVCSSAPTPTSHFKLRAGGWGVAQDLVGSAQILSYN